MKYSQVPVSALLLEQMFLDGHSCSSRQRARNSAKVTQCGELVRRRRAGGGRDWTTRVTRMDSLKNELVRGLVHVGVFLGMQPDRPNVRRSPGKEEDQREDSWME